MKKTYLEPAIEVLATETDDMILAVSSVYNEYNDGDTQLSRENPFGDEEM